MDPVRSAMRESNLRPSGKKEDYLAQARRYVATAERLLGARPRFILCMLSYAGALHLQPLDQALKR
jgi:hypothetical protein